jgi:signal transduction histidine kinase
LAVEFETVGEPAPVPSDAALALVRVTQEALVNAAKHAPQRRVTVRLDFRDTGVQLSVRNQVATEPLPASDVRTADLGYGLTGMRERIRLLRGALDAGSQDGEWVVTAELPLHNLAPSTLAPRSTDTMTS